MIINVRSTSGGGKTYAMRQVMSALEAKHAWERPVHIEGRKRPLYHLWKTGHGEEIMFLGSYETPCGGCDTLTWGSKNTFNLIREFDSKGRHVLFEGLLISSDVANIVALHQEGRKVLVIAIDHPLEACLAAVNARRRAKDPERADVNPKNTTAKFKSVIKSMERLEAAGVEAIWLPRETAAEEILRRLACK